MRVGGVGQVEDAEWVLSGDGAGSSAGFSAGFSAGEADAVLESGAGSGQADAVLAGPASSVLLALWKRVPLDSPGLTVTGDVEAARRVVGSALTP